MADLSKIEKSQIVKNPDGKTAKKYTVLEEVIDLKALMQEKANLEEILNMVEPTTEELIEMGKNAHTYYSNKDWAITRIKEIDEILK